MQITADTKELKLLAADLRRAGIKIESPVTKELKAAAQQIKATSRELVHKDTGKTRDSISYSRRAQGLSYEIGPTWYVGRFLEYGTVRMPAYPFMQPAVVRHYEDMVAKISNAAADNTFTGPSVSSLI